MYKMTLIAIVVFTSQLYAQEGLKVSLPTLYGKINKEMGYIKQDDESRKTFSGVRDVDNSETRLGVKGTIEMEPVKTTYAIEVGLNSSHTSNSSTGRLRMRLAEVKFESQFGQLTIGQAFTPIAKKTLTLDPFSNTILGLAHSDQPDLLSGSRKVGKGGLGALYRARTDLIAYTTPLLAGLSYTISTDKTNKMSTDPSDSEYGVTTYEHLLDYNQVFGQTKLNLFFAYQTTGDATVKSDTDMFYGFKVEYQALALAFAMTNSEIEQGPNKQEIDRMIGSLAYRVAPAHLVAFTYQAAKDDNKIATSKEVFTQFALGYKYQYNKYVQLKAVAGLYNYEDKNASANDNDSTVVTFGTELKF